MNAMQAVLLVLGAVLVVAGAALIDSALGFLALGVLMLLAVVDLRGPGNGGGPA